MDTEVDQYYQSCMKMKVDRETKTNYMDQIMDCKQKIAKVMSVLKNAVLNNMKITNEAIA